MVKRTTKPTAVQLSEAVSDELKAVGHFLTVYEMFSFGRLF
jgi:hypothetical protein